MPIIIDTIWRTAWGSIAHNIRSGMPDSLEAEVEALCLLHLPVVIFEWPVMGLQNVVR